MVPLSMTLSDLWPGFQGHDIFLKLNIRKTARLKDKVTIAQEESIPNIWNDSMFGDLDWPLNASRGFVSISWASCLPWDAVRKRGLCCRPVYTYYPSVRLSVTFVYCIQTTDGIVKLLSRPSSHIILIFDPCTDTLQRGRPIHRRWVKFAIFDSNRRLPLYCLSTWLYWLAFCHAI